MGGSRTIGGGGRPFGSGGLQSEHTETLPTVEPGQVIGLKQTAQSFAPEGEFMSLTFSAYLDAPREQDTITIQGKPDLEVALKGANGDIAAIAIIVNSIKRVMQSAPGLVAMRDIPIVSIW